MNKPLGIESVRLDERMAQERKNIFARLPSAYAASRSQAQRLLGAAGDLTSVEWRTIWDLHNVGPLTIRELSEIQQSDHSLLSRALPEMRRKGYVEVERDPRDGRQTIVALAPAGLAAYQKAAPIMARRRAALREHFTPEELANFISYFDRLESFFRIPIENTVNDKEPTE